MLKGLPKGRGSYSLKATCTSSILHSLHASRWKSCKTGQQKSANSWATAEMTILTQQFMARFTKYLTTIYQNPDNAIVTIDLQRTTNLPNRLTKGARLFLGMIHLQNCKIVWDSARKLACGIPKRSFSMLQVTIVSRSYDKLTINRKIFCKLGPRFQRPPCNWVFDMKQNVTRITSLSTVAKNRKTVSSRVSAFDRWPNRKTWLVTK